MKTHVEQCLSKKFHFLLRFFFEYVVVPALAQAIIFVKVAISIDHAIIDGHANVKYLKRVWFIYISARNVR